MNSLITLTFEEAVALAVLFAFLILGVQLIALALGGILFNTWQRRREAKALAQSHIEPTDLIDSKVGREPARQGLPIAPRTVVANQPRIPVHHF